MESPTSEKEPRWIKLRYPGMCATCGIALSKGTLALWNGAARTATCEACAPGHHHLHEHAAGASATAEADRRAGKRVEQVRRRHGDHAAEVAREMANRDMDATWRKGGDGESRLAAYIAGELGDRVIGLHDRLIPGTRGNIDHVFIAPVGVWIVDAKSYVGKVEMRESGPIWNRERLVYVNGRNRTSRAKAMDRQIAAVKAALGPERTDVYAGLCFVDSEWGLLDFPFSVGKIWVGYPGALRKQLSKKGPLDRVAMERIATRLDLSLPPAT